MNRLTFHKADGKFGVVGMCENNEEQKLYGCICKLKNYEDTGYSPDFIDSIPDILEDIKVSLCLMPKSEIVKNINAKIDYIINAKEKDR